MRSSSWTVVLFAAMVATVAGQTETASTTDPSAPAPAAASDLNLITLPTTQPLKRHGTYFRLTHRFTRDLGFGTVGDLAEDLFGLDAGSIVGFEFRFAPTANVHVSAHRSNFFKDIQLSARYDVRQQNSSWPIGLSFIGSIDYTVFAGLGARLRLRPTRNSFGTTFGQIARGGGRNNAYLGFNLARRF